MEEKVVAAQPQDTPKNATFRVLVGFGFHSPPLWDLRGQTNA